MKMGVTRKRGSKIVHEDADNPLFTYVYRQQTLTEELGIGQSHANSRGRGIGPIISALGWALSPGVRAEIDQSILCVELCGV